jgi:hypothetical protein
MRGRWVPTGRGTVRAVGVIVLVGLAGSAAALSPPTSAPTASVVEDACADADGSGAVTVTDGAANR